MIHCQLMIGKILVDDEEVKKPVPKVVKKLEPKIEEQPNSDDIPFKEITHWHSKKKLGIEKMWVDSGFEGREQSRGMKFINFMHSYAISLVGTTLISSQKIEEIKSKKHEKKVVEAPAKKSDKVLSMTEKNKSEKNTKILEDEERDLKFNYAYLKEQNFTVESQQSFMERFFLKCKTFLVKSNVGIFLINSYVSMIDPTKLSKRSTLRQVSRIIEIIEIITANAFEEKKQWIHI